MRPTCVTPVVPVASARAACLSRRGSGAAAAVVFAMLALEASVAKAEPTDPRRKYQLVRDNENWAWLRSQGRADSVAVSVSVPAVSALGATAASGAPSDSATALTAERTVVVEPALPEGEVATGKLRLVDPWDPVKYIRLAPNRDDIYLTLGGEMRQWVEGYHNERWGDVPPPTKAYWLQRYMLHADTHLTPWARVFVQAKSGIEAFRPGGPRPPDQDTLDINQAYIDAVFVPGPTLDDVPGLVLRVGRQELSYGSGRMIEVREGPNVRFGHDGVRLIARPGPFRVDAFLVRPSETNPGVFDDGPDKTQALWGLWGTFSMPDFLVDAYYFGRQRDEAEFQRGTAEEVRHTVGSRLRGKKGFVELEGEGAYQFGTFGDIGIRAWTVAFEALARGNSLPLKPVVTLGGGVTSGDGGATRNTLGTFSAPFPRGAFFGLGSANGPSNNFSPHGTLALSLPASISLSGVVWMFWRQNDNDGIYGVPGNLLREGTTADSRFFGTQVQGFITWQADPHFSLNGSYSHFWTGDFFATSSPGKDIDFAAAWATYKF